MLLKMLFPIEHKQNNFAAIERYMALTAKNRFDSPTANEYQWGDWVSFDSLESHDG